MAKKILIDTDPGIDDALAILLALASPEVQVEGLTVVSGNCTVDQGVTNALSILKMIDREDIPVRRGAAVPLVQPLLIAPETHGGAGFGYARLAPADTPVHPQHAVDFLVERILAQPGEITLVCIGPLTNLALALRLHPEIIPAIPEVILMGGAIRHGGNTSPLAEFNTYCDPHAAHIVFHSGLPITLVPLDVTYQVIFTRQDLLRLSPQSSRVAGFIADATRFYMEFHDEYQQIDGCVINDPLALAIAFAPHFVDTQALFVDVDISGGVSMGKTFADFYALQKKPVNMDVALDVRARAFIEFFLERIGWLCRAFPDGDEA